MQALITPTAAQAKQSPVVYLDQCTCCGHDFTASTIEIDNGVCPSCEKTSASIVDRMVNQTINSVINQLKAQGGHEANIQKLQSLTQEQKHRVVERWYSS